MASAKPADFFLGVVEFFAILLPGAALFYLIKPWVLCHVPLDLIPTDRVVSWAVFLVMSYLTGHLLHAIGGYLDKLVYTETYGSSGISVGKKGQFCGPDSVWAVRGIRTNSANVWATGGRPAGSHPTGCPH